MTRMHKLLQIAFMNSAIKDPIVERQAREKLIHEGEQSAYDFVRPIYEARVRD